MITSRHSIFLDEVERYLGYRPSTVRTYTDTTNFFAIDRGDILSLHGGNYLIIGTMRERGFGLDDEPKHWVKHAIECETGRHKIIKLVFLEHFMMRLGDTTVRCFRSPAKEARVLECVQRHPQFMKGFGVRDATGNEVRVIDFISGPDLSSYLLDGASTHEAYFYERMPMILWRLLPCLEALHFLHEVHERHGDVRADHVLVDQQTGLFRWIDFDYDFDYREVPFSLDILGAGDLIALIVGRGIIEAGRIEREPALAGMLDRLTPDDLSVVNRGRLMNLGKAYPYIPESLNRILLHFSSGAEVFYESMAELIDDLREAVSQLLRG
jgi:hypothetical protein